MTIAGRRSFLLSCSLLVVTASCGESTGPPDDEPVRAELAWSLPTESGPAGAVTVGRDGTVYFSLSRGLVAVDAEGVVRWSQPTSSHSAPAIGEDGTLYAGNRATGTAVSLRAIDPDGTVLWGRPAIGSVAVSPAVGKDGTVYFIAQTSGTGTLRAVSPVDGETLWTLHFSDGFFHSSPAIAEDGTIYVGGGTGRLYAVNPDGTERWTFPAPLQSRLYGPVITRDGVIVFGRASRLYAVNPDGVERWSLEVGPVESAPSIGSDGTIYIGGATGVHAVHPDGSLLWSSGEYVVTTTPIIGADGSIYVGTDEGQVISLSSDGSTRWEYPLEAPISHTLALGLDGKILVASDDSTAYAIEEIPSTNGGFESAPWPTDSGDRANSGRAKGS